MNRIPVIVVGFLPALLPPNEAAAAPANRAAGAERVAALVRTFIKSKDDIEQRRRIAREVHAIAPEAIRQLVAVADGELKSDTRQYLIAFAAQAKKAAAAKRRSADREQAEAWQRILLDRQVTKEYLKAKAGPAMKKLRDAVAVTPAEILQSAAQLKKQCEVLLEQIAAAGTYRQLLPEADKKSSNAAQSLPEAVKASLARDEQLLAMIALPLAPGDRSIMAGNFRLRGRIEPAEVLGVFDVNVMRTLMGLPALEIDVKLCEAARGHSRDMAEKNFFSHTSPVEGKRRFSDRARRAGTSARGECICLGQRSFHAANQTWFHSPGHHGIIFSRRARRIGYGQYKRRWTLMVG